MAPQYFALQTDENGSPRWVNRRAYVRYQCALATAGKVYPAKRQDFLRAWVLDLSRGGAGLLLNQRLLVDDEVVVQISAQGSRERYDFPARVIHVSPHVSGEWLIGFEFLAPLTDDLLDVLL